jgi:hypothetical protein
MLCTPAVKGTAFCGDGTIGAGENCEGSNLGGATCQSLGFESGALACGPDCQFDTSGCMCIAGGAAFPASGQTTAYTADKNDGIAGPVAVPDDGTVQAGATLSYTDNGDGTITDNNTGLTWEKKSEDTGLHDKDNVYRWSGDGSQETIWDGLDDVNAEGGTGFAGHNDWRIPNLKELQSIVNYQNVNPPVSAAFNTGCVGGCTVTSCSCTAVFSYWSSTTGATAFPPAAWAVSFTTGAMGLLGKTGATSIRAVRGGS